MNKDTIIKCNADCEARSIARIWKVLSKPCDVSDYVLNMTEKGRLKSTLLLLQSKNTSLRVANCDVAVSDIQYVRDCFTNIRNDDIKCSSRMLGFLPQQFGRRQPSPQPSLIGEGVKNGRLGISAQQHGFTLAEVLITLVIIGIIAAITVPMIHANYKKQETVAKLKKTYSVLSQLVKLSQLDNGPADEWFNDVKDNPEILFNKYFKPYLKNAKLAKESYFYTETYPFKYINGTNTMHNTKKDSPKITFSLDDGTIIIVMSQKDTNVEDTVPIWIDINGEEGPNQWGKDVFIMRIYKGKGLFPNGHFDSNSSVKYDCSRKATYGGSSCFEKIMRDGWEIKNGYLW